MYYWMYGVILSYHAGGYPPREDNYPTNYIAI